MVVLRSCCLCISPRTGSFILGTIGIILGATLLAPMAVFLDFHSYYVTQFVASERVGGNYIDDDQVPKMAFFSKLLFSALLSLDVIYIFSCIFLLAGIATTKHMLILPWLVFVACAIITNVTLVISFMISIADYGAVAVFLGSSPCLGLVTYLWFVVFAAYQMVKKEDISLRGTQVGGPAAASASHSSLTSIKEGLHRVIGGTPPPPYEAVTTKSSPRQMNICKPTVAPSPSPSLADLLHSTTTENRAKLDQTPRSTPSTSRRSSDRTPSTKPASPVSLRQNCKPIDLSTGSMTPDSPFPSPSLKPLSPLPPHPSFPHKTITASQSHNQICKAQQPTLKKSQSNALNPHAAHLSPTKPINLQSPLLPISQPPTSPLVPPPQVPLPLIRQEAIENDNSSVLSDDTSSMSSTSLSIHDTNLIL
eukprot:TRINITY_DN5087_c0_g1_i1.p1 TRINITY_DN5087_c0_g1~~TRINITY_DN5087_c0_g1_i1.p1  ORF type:complete len:421 (-),score=48.53 TRINITY_DN5087_c0_g1_i1:145-1407(-)